ncbi:hypothetical protein [Pseudomonas brassicacearum]|uniref:Tetratricopeptide repeat protein n=1 Tax=Pseudomonas brassicacearum TaxID=930166 RepID=A0A423H1Y5_9PSED|nr:hypothetical protein [Pseudomonas brassicacearum]RON06246.1 hypothetical protein BK658_00205 [Pseudomonas brassicacearum]
MVFKDYAAIAAGLAGVAGLVISLITLFMKGEENRRTIRSQLTDVLARLNVVNAESRKYRIETAESGLNPEKRAMFSFYNDQRAFLVGQARYLMDQLPDHVSDSEFGLVAKALGAIGDHELACHYWEMCLERSPSDHVRGMHSRGFGGYLFGEGYPELGRFRFQSGVALIAGTSDQRRYHRVETYLRWAAAERFSGFFTEAKEVIDKAMAEVSLIQSQSMRKRCAQTIREYGEELPQPAVRASNQVMS